MAVTSVVKVKINFSQDVEYGQEFEAASNTSSPGEIDYVDLLIGANTITPPTGAKGVTIIPPSANTNLITLKGVAGDTGVVLHLTNPTFISLNSAASTFVLNAAAGISGLRLIWS